RLPRLNRLIFIAIFAASVNTALAQRGGGVPVGGMGGIGTLPVINVGGADAGFARLDFAQMMLDDQNKQQKNNKEQQQLVESGALSALDLKAPTKAIAEFNKASELMRGQDAAEAVKHLEKALSFYPDFVSAHNDLGLAYLTLDQHERANAEFETAARLDS